MIWDIAYWLVGVLMIAVEATVLIVIVGCIGLLIYSFATETSRMDKKDESDANR